MYDAFRYGKWGYQFGRAGFNIQRKEYEHAVGIVHNIPVEALQADFKGVDEVRQAVHQAV